MKILWICNTYTNAAALLFKKKSTPFGGWIEGLEKEIIRNSQVQLFVVFNSNDGSDEIVKKNNGDTVYYSFSFKVNVQANINDILSEVNPDIVHVHGVEFEQSDEIIKAINRRHVVASIQGLKSFYGLSYELGIDKKFRSRIPLSYIGLTKGSISHYAKRFIVSSKQEIKSIQHLNYIFGRTSYDYATTLQINPKRNYYYVGEILRETFYDERKWDYRFVECNSIYVSNIGYSIKGGHYLIKALAIMLQRYPNFKAYIAGPNLQKRDTFRDKMKQSSYGFYISNLIKKYHLENNVEFVGLLDEKQVKEYLLKCNVFVLPSICENSPNSLGEAMITGTPIVSSFCGGVPDLITHQKEGYLYPAYEYYMLAYWISYVFDNPEKASELSKNEIKRANVLYNKEAISGQLIAAYKQIIGDNSSEKKDVCNE